MSIISINYTAYILHLSNETILYIMGLMMDADLFNFNLTCSRIGLLWLKHKKYLFNTRSLVRVVIPIEMNSFINSIVNNTISGELTQYILLWNRSIYLTNILHTMVINVEKTYKYGAIDNICLVNHKIKHAYSRKYFANNKIIKWIVDGAGEYTRIVIEIRNGNTILERYRELKSSITRIAVEHFILYKDTVKLVALTVGSEYININIAPVRYTEFISIDNLYIDPTTQITGISIYNIFMFRYIWEIFNKN